MPHTLFICRTCHHSKPKPAPEARDGAALESAAQEWLSEWGLADDFTVQPTACLGLCSQSVNGALCAPRKCSVVLSHLGPETKETLRDYCQAYATEPQGRVKPKQLPNPEAAKALFVTRSPALPVSEAAAGQVPLVEGLAEAAIHPLKGEADDQAAA